MSIGSDETVSNNELSGCSNVEYILFLIITRDLYSNPRFYASFTLLMQSAPGNCKVMYIHQHKRKRGKVDTKKTK